MIDCFINFQDYCEIRLMSGNDEDGYCYRCGKELKPLTYLEPEYFYQPCWDCLAKRKKSERDTHQAALVKSIHDFYSRLLGDRYYQLFLVDDIYPDTTFPHTYGVFKKVINALDPPSRNDIWFLDWIPGYPKIISTDNLSGIKIVNLTKLYTPLELGKESIKVGEYEIKLPEFTTFDSRHHSRYSVLNKNGDRKSKRIKLGERCVKLYNTDTEDVKSIFRVTKGGEEIPVGSLSYQDYVILKLAIMRDKTFLRLVFDILEECCRVVGTLRDTVFLKNTVTLDPKHPDLSVTLLWSEESEYRDPGNINISII